MRIPTKQILFVCICIFPRLYGFSQDSTLLLQTYVNDVAVKANSVKEKIDKKSGKALKSMEKQEARIRRKLSKIDSVMAISIFSEVSGKYEELKNRITAGKLAGGYVPSLDTMLTSLKFFERNPQLLASVKDSREKLDAALQKVNGLRSEIQKAEAIKQFIKERKELLKAQLSRFGFAKELRKLNKQYYYYAEQIKEYKAILKDKKKERIRRLNS